jgi:hypothetical protein
MSGMSTLPKKAAIWLSPFAGAFAVALFLAIRALMMPDRVLVFVSFVAWLIQRSAVGYVCALPLVGLARWFGLRHAVGFMLLATLAAVPLELSVSTPINAWHPTEEELDHGFYWDTFLPSILLSSVTGAVFWLGVHGNKPNKSPEPTSGTVTPPAEPGVAPAPPVAHL